MLASVKALTGYTIRAKDGEIGEVDEFYFDDREWTIRYLVVNTGSWLEDRRVLISPTSFGGQQPGRKVFAVDLTRRQVENSPDIDTAKPVSRQQEILLGQYYNWPSYWSAAGLNTAGAPIMPLPLIPPDAPAPGGGKTPPLAEKGDPHLRSTREVVGYHLQAANGELGHIEDFIVQEDNWVIRYIVVDTRNWLPGKKVLIAPQWIQRIDWAEKKVVVDMKREMIEKGPEYDPDAPLSREYEEKLHRAFNRTGYWRT